MKKSIEEVIKAQGLVLGHPSGLFTLFFTEMWERFSYYGMRALLVLFLTASIIEGGGGGFGWEEDSALQLYALYTGLVYFTPLFGGMLADKFLGYRKAVIIGAFTMAFGHLCMAVETESSFFIGLLALILGNGLFKPNISSMVGQLYKDEKRKDAAYTIFYMGINAGAFLGILLCGYIGERYSWSYGFGLAMVFMIVGAVQFWLSGKLFGPIGAKPERDTLADVGHPVETGPVNKQRLITWIGIGAAIAAVIYLLIYFFSPLKDTSTLLKTVNTTIMPSILLGCSIGIVGFLMSDSSLTKIEKDRLWVIVVLTSFTVFFWWAFEQAGGSMTIFARDYTERNLAGSAAQTFKIINTLLTVVPLLVITWVLLLLTKATIAKTQFSGIVLLAGFAFIWYIVGWMLRREFSSDTTEVPASWFSILNSFFIIVFASAFSKFWDLGIIKSGPIKFAMGLLLLAGGFAILSFGCAGIPNGAETAAVSMVWLIMAYLFHTLGELCLSPVGLSYVSKLAPLRLVGVMFGVFFIANFIANWAAGMTGSYIEPIAENNGLQFFFMIFAVIPAGAAVILILLNGKLKKMMHGIE